MSWLKREYAKNLWYFFFRFSRYLFVFTVHAIRLIEFIVIKYNIFSRVSFSVGSREKKKNLISCFNFRILRSSNSANVNIQHQKKWCNVFGFRLHIDYIRLVLVFNFAQLSEWNQLIKYEREEKKKPDRENKMHVEKIRF